MIWGSTFLVTQQTIKLISPFQYLGLCFGVAALSLALIFPGHLRRIRRAEVFSGSMIGLFLFAGYALQAHGLQYTTSSKAGFITGLNVPLVPLLSLLLLRQKPTRASVIGIVLSLVGLTLLSCERFLGSVRRECLDHLFILQEKQLQRVLTAYVQYFNQARPHQGIKQQIPERYRELVPLDHQGGKILALPVLGGLHHDYRRSA